MVKRIPPTPARGPITPKVVAKAVEAVAPVAAPAPLPIVQAAPATPGIHLLHPNASTPTLRADALGSAKVLWKYRRAIIFGGVATYSLVQYLQQRQRAAKRDFVDDNSILYWKVYDGSIVETQSTASSLSSLVTTAGNGGGGAEGPARVMTLYEVIKTIRSAGQDPRVRGIIADFSSVGVPATANYTLGLAQLEEIQAALSELRKTKHQQLGKEGWKTVAFTDSFGSQGQFLFASSFDEVYTQPTGQLPLVGMSSTIPFFGRLLKYLGINVLAEARNEYKSFVAPYTEERLSDAQRENQASLITDLNDNLLTYIARNRYPSLTTEEGLAKVKAFTQIGPFSASECVANGLLTGTAYKQDIIDKIFDPKAGGDETRKLKGFYQYAKSMEKIRARGDHVDVGVVYLLGTISSGGGEFGTSAVVKGLKEAADDPSIGSVILRIDSGGGGVVESDTIWAAVRDLKKKGKHVIASFGNASASGGYLVSTHADLIMASPSTITGSIGVAALRPSLTQAFFDRIHLTTDSFHTGSRSQDLTHDLTPEERIRYALQIDEMYDDFKNRVCQGRGISQDVIESIAGGRVYTGLQAFGLNRPAEMLNQIRGFGVPLPQLAVEGEIKAVEMTPLLVQEVENEIRKGTLKIEATLPPAVVNSTTSDAVDPDTPVPAAKPRKAAVLQLVNGGESKSEGARGKGKGLIDVLGGISDAADLAASLMSAKALAQFGLLPPAERAAELKKVLPHATLNVLEDNKLSLEMDVRLKRFPRSKTFWQQVAEGARQGDSSTDLVASLAHHVKLSASIWIIGLAQTTLANELEDLGVNMRGSSNGSTSALGLGLGGSSASFNRGRYGTMRVEL